MSVWIRRNILGLVAIFIALTAGAYAAGLPKNSVKSKQIKNGQVKASDLAANSVDGSKVANGSLHRADFGGSVAGPAGPRGPEGPQGPPGPLGAAGGDLTGTYPNPQIAAGAVGGDEVPADALGGADIDETSLDSSILQSRVGGSCPTGQSIRSIAANGTVGCETDDAGGSPSGAAGGDLTGSYPNPQIGSNAVGTNEVDGSLNGNDIDESTLFNDNSLNDADIDQGTLGLAAGQTRFDHTVISPGVGNFTFSSIASRYQVRYSCPTTLTDPGSIVFGNLTPGPMRIFVDDGGSNPAFYVLNGGTGKVFSTNASGDRYVITYQATPSSAIYGTVTVDSVHDATSCYAQAQGLISG